MAFRDRVRSALYELTMDRQPIAVLNNVTSETIPGMIVSDDSAMRFFIMNLGDVQSKPIASVSEAKAVSRIRETHFWHHLCH